MLPDAAAGAGSHGTTPHYVARPGGNALNVAVAAGRLGVPVRLLARLGTGPLAVGLRRHVELSGVDLGGVVPATQPGSPAGGGGGAPGPPGHGFPVRGAPRRPWGHAERAPRP